MGFHDLQLFNKALLARQGWRFLQHSNSLVYRFLKAKYFPHTSFLEAPVPNNVSYIWRSLCESRHVLRAGLRWCVGTDTCIKAWTDAWLPSPTTYKVISSVRGLSEEAIVDSLIDHDLMCWNTDLLGQVLLPRDVEIIKQITLSKRRPSDRLIWTGTSMGNLQSVVLIIYYYMNKIGYWSLLLGGRVHLSICGLQFGLRRFNQKFGYLCGVLVWI
jgi:hypothetical protein